MRGHIALLCNNTVLMQQTHVVLYCRRFGRMSAVASTSGASVKMVWASNNSTSNSNSTVSAHSGSNRHRSLLDSSSTFGLQQSGGTDAADESITSAAAASVLHSGNFIITDGNIDYSALHSGTEDIAAAIASTWQYYNSLNTDSSDVSSSNRQWREFKFKSVTASSSNGGFAGSVRSSVSYWLQQLFQSTASADVSNTSVVTTRRLVTNSTNTNTPITATVAATATAAAAAKPLIAAAVLPAVPVVVWPDDAVVDAVQQSEMTLLMPSVSISPRITANGKDCVFLLNFQANAQVLDSSNSNSNSAKQPFTPPVNNAGNNAGTSGTTAAKNTADSSDDQTLFDSVWVDNFSGEIVGINCDFYAGIDAHAKRTNWEKVTNT
jgi:hypothetical protein